jgi:NAD(P)-dependent dehydrogenase (short-subunit alcohol dehydrogenase family)
MSCWNGCGYGLQEAAVDLGLAGRRAIVTGASKGIGLAVTRRLVAEGAVVVTGSRGTTPELKELVNTGAVTAVNVDLTSTDGPDRLVAAAPEAGPVDILVNNAGAVTPRVDGFLSITDEQWCQSLQLTFMTAVRTTRALLPHMLQRRAGSIVNTASVNSTLPDPLVIDYSAAKAALASFSKALSKEVGRSGVRVNAVAPGPVATGLWLGEHGVAASVSAATGARPDEIAESAVAGSATGRFSTPEEVADLITFLASDRAANITGANYTIDGGLIQTL